MVNPASISDSIGLRNVEAVLFDAVGTLIAPDPSVVEAYHAHAARFGSRLPRHEIDARFRAAFAAEERLDTTHLGCRTSQDRESRRWRAIVSQVIDDVSDPEGLFGALWEHFARPSSWRLYDDAAVAVSRLFARGVRLGIASNFDSRLCDMWRAMPQLAGLEAVFVSSELGWRKPHVEFFRAIEHRLTAEPDKLLLAGDDLENDYLAASAAGWHAVLVDRQRQHAHASVPASDRVTSLDNLDRQIADRA